MPWTISVVLPIGAPPNCRQVLIDLSLVNSQGEDSSKVSFAARTHPGNNPFLQDWIMPVSAIAGGHSRLPFSPSG